ncbi:MAG: hypothetical protein M1588_01320 [Planctomycetes bacterium]|nr:hypothetical protein [Planctomycetota bacterium]
MKMAGGAELDPDETPAFQRSLHLLRKSPQAIALDLSEGRKILAAKKWLSTYDAIKNKKELTAAATRIAEFDEQLRRVIGDIRNEAAPYHTKVTELQRNEFSVTHNAATARGWDHWLEGRFEPDPQALDRIRGAV